MKFRSNCVIALLLFANLSYGQKLKFTDVLNAYKLDSSSLKTFCSEKQFELINVKEDNWIFTYTFQSALDKNISFVRTFPKDQSDKVYLYYYFDDKNDYKEFKDSIQKNGFKKFRTYETFPDNPNMGDHREAYVKGDLELELSTSNSSTTRKALLLYKRINF